MTDDAEQAMTQGPRALVEMAELVGEQGHVSNRRRWDRLVEEWLAARRVLAESARGRETIASLMDDPRVTVRLWAAGAVLFWDPESAGPVLVAIRDFPLEHDLHSIIAKHTLRDFDAGTLDPGSRLPGT